MYKNLLTSITDRILTITINRETKLNALNKDTLLEIGEVVMDAQQDSRVSAIILTGSGSKAFAAGADIAELQHLDPHAGYKLAKQVQEEVLNKIEQSSKPIVAAINGFALGGGLELAIACHIRIASENAKMGLPEVSLGLIPGYGGTQRIPALIGKGRAFELILSGDMIDAPSAYRIGLINHVVPHDFLISSATVLLQKIIKRSPLAVSAAIRAINQFGSPAGFESEIKEFGDCFGTQDSKEGINAFIEKREPRFKN